MALNADQTHRFVRTIAGMARQPDLRVQPAAAVHLVLAMRLRPVLERAARDPAAELVERLGSIAATLAVLAVCEQALAAWPAPFAVNRLECVKLSPDEYTLALMARAAIAGDRAEFAAALDGFVRASRHDRLFDAVVRAVALAPSAGPR